MTSLGSVASFTNLGYRLHSRSHTAIDSNIEGKTVLITGATGGLGRSVAERLGGMGARLLLVGRDEQKLELLRSSNSGLDIVTYQADLSLMSEVRRLADAVLENEARLDVLVNNVGVLFPERHETTEGLERTFATNLAGHFLLTNRLAGLLVESAPARIVNVTSGGMYAERIVPDDLNFRSGDYRGTVAYARTKRAQVILTEMWADRLFPQVTVHAMHPGWAKTQGVERSLPTFNRLMRPWLRTPEEGADTAVWLASHSGKPRTTTGLLWFDRSPVDTHLVRRTRETDAERAELWSNLVGMTGQDLDVTRKETI